MQEDNYCGSTATNADEANQVDRNKAKERAGILRDEALVGRKRLRAGRRSTIRKSRGSEDDEEGEEWR